MKFKIDKTNWKPVKLSDVVIKKEENDKENAKNRFDRFLKVEHMDTGSLHIKRWASQEAGEEINPTFYKIFRKGQILFPTRNPHLKRTALASFDGICGEKTLTLEPIEEMILPEFPPFIFHSESFYAHTTSSIVGSTNPHCRWRDVADYEFLLPPKEQQGELAELLWSMDEVIEKELALLEKLEVFEKQYLSELIIEKTAKKEKCDWLPLGELYKKKFKSIKPEQFSEKQVLHYSLPSYLDDRKPEKIMGYSIKSNKILIDDDAILFSKLNPNNPKIWAVNPEDGKTKIGSTEWLPVRPNDEITKEYILAYLSSQYFTNQVMRFVQGSSNSHKRIDPQRFYILKFPVLNPFERGVIAESYAKVVDAESNAALKISKSKSLQKSLINQVF